MNDSGWNMYVFREGRKNVRGVELTTELGRWLDKMSTCPGDDAGLGALIAAGELECALADAGEGGVAAAAAITDDLAGSLFGSLCRSPRELARQAASIGTPETVCVSVAEGFAYYAHLPFWL